MTDTLKLMAVLAHPDDETLGFGGVMAKYAQEDVETSLVVATLGERGWQGEKDENPGLDTLGKLREQELRGAAEALGIRHVRKLGLIDGEIQDADPRATAQKIARHIRELRPHVVVTFDPRGAYGHPDHIAISQFALAGVVMAADPTAGHVPGDPHGVSKFYYRVWTPEENAAYATVFGELALDVAGVTRRFAPWEDWAITTRVDTKAYWETVWKAVQHHQSQVPSLQKLGAVSDEIKIAVFGCEGYYRAFSTVNGGSEREEDLFEGLRR